MLLQSFQGVFSRENAPAAPPLCIDSVLEERKVCFREQGGGFWQLSSSVLKQPYEVSVDAAMASVISELEKEEQSV